MESHHYRHCAVSSPAAQCSALPGNRGPPGGAFFFLTFLSALCILPKIESGNAALLPGGSLQANAPRDLLSLLYATTGGLREILHHYARVQSGRLHHRGHPLCFRPHQGLRVDRHRQRIHRRNSALPPSPPPPTSQRPDLHPHRKQRLCRRLQSRPSGSHRRLPNSPQQRYRRHRGLGRLSRRRHPPCGG